MRDYLRIEGDPRADSIEAEFLHTKERRSQEMQPKLRLNAKDHTFFEKVIIGGEAIPDGDRKRLRESHVRLLDAKDLCTRHISSMVKHTGSPAEKLLDWVDFIEQNLKVVVVDAPDDVNAYTIFETLNDRGAGLSLADQLKNYLFGRSGQRIDEVEHAWNSMFGALEAIGGEELILTYIHHLWSSLYGTTREKDLYSEIKKNKKSKVDVTDFAESLDRHASLYAAVVSPKKSFWGKYGGFAREAAFVLDTLRLKKFRPLMLAVLSEFSDPEVAQTVRYLVSCSVRFLIVGGIGGGTMERIYGDMAKRVRSGEIETARALAAAMSTQVPSDAEFEGAFGTARVSQAYLARYYLSALERTARGEGESELVTNTNEQEVNLEHVLPQNPSPDWNLSDIELAQALYKRIGNLALVKQKVNSQVGNSGFASKKRSYLSSDLKLTKQVGEYDAWGEPQITERQRELAKLAVKTWPATLT